MNLKLRHYLIAAAAACLTLPRCGLAQTNDANWVTPFSPPGVGGNIYALAATATSLYVGGNFSTNDFSLVGNGVARWDSNGWSNLGGGINPAAGASVAAIAVADPNPEGHKGQAG